MTIRIHSRRSGGYGITWTVAGIKHSAHAATRPEAIALRADIEARVNRKLDASPVPREWRVKGAETRNASLTADERSAAARHAARVRWGRL